MPKPSPTHPLIATRLLPCARTTVMAALLAVLPAPAFAAPGALDPSFAGFGVEGSACVFGCPMGDGDRGMVVQPDGKIVMAGYTGNGILVMRYLPDGRPDPTFGGGDGVFTAQHPTETVRGTSVAVQADGRIVVAGWADTQPADFMVARIMPAGNGMDGSFGVAGFALTDFDGDTDQAYRVLIQSDGKIIAAGRALIGGDYDFAVARYNPDGSLDNTFAGDGKGSVGFGDIGPNANEACYDIALQPDGRLVMVGGITGYVGDGKFKVARFTTGGAPDPTFHFDGKVELEFALLDIRATAVALEPDGRIVVAGSDGISGGSLGYTFVAVYLPNGILDDTFDGDGHVTLPDTHGDIRDAAVQPDGKIVLIGYDEYSSDHLGILMIYRFNLDGSLDSSLDMDGRAGFVLGAYATGYDLALLPDGRMLGFGSVNSDHVLIRVWPDGSLDGGGKQALGFTTPGFGPASNEVGYAMAVQPDGKLVVAGTIYDGNHATSDFGVSRFLANGQVDDSFGVSGRATFAFDQPDIATSVALQPDGKIVVGGYTDNGGGNLDFMVVRFNADGSVDGSFGFLGFRVLDFLGGGDYGYAVAVGPDGKIVVAGTVYNGTQLVFGVARFNSNGSTDLSFDTDGRRMVEFSVGTSHWATSVVVLPDNRILVGGTVGANFALTRLTVSGSLDTSFGGLFGGSGMVTYDFGGNDYLNALKVDSYGAIYAAGVRDVGGHTVFALLRVPSYGKYVVCIPNPCDDWSNGKLTIDWGVNAAAYAIDVRSDNQVLVAGIAGGRLAWAQVGIQRDPVPLMATTDFSGDQETAFGARFVESSKIVLAGYYAVNGQQAFALARFYTTGNLVSVEPGAGEAPPACALGSAFPNPFRDRSTIAFDLPRAEPARLAVYDVAGRRVRTLADGPLGAGHHEGTWDGTDDRGRAVAAGVYFARLDAGGSSARRAVVVLR